MASTYSTWDYYHGTYSGKLDEGNYKRMAIQAAAEIDRRTLGRAISWVGQSPDRAGGTPRKVWTWSGGSR